MTKEENNESDPTKNNEPNLPSKPKTQGILKNKEEAQNQENDKKEEKKIEEKKEEKVEDQKKEDLKSENKSNIIENKDNNPKNDFLSKVKMFQSKADAAAEEKKNEKLKKKVMIDEAGIKKDKEKDNAKDQRMNKAMARLKKRREKDAGQAEEPVKKDNKENDPLFKSVRIKNMASLLETQLSQTVSGDVNASKDINYKTQSSKSVTSKEIKEGTEDDGFQRMVSMYNDQPGKVVFKRKMSKKKFEES